MKPQNFLKETQNFGSRKSIKDFLGNKKADISITILVLGVIALCILALLSFYLSETKQKSEGVDSFFYLQEVYNLAESVKYSDVEGIDNYEAVKYESGDFVVEKTFLKQTGWVFKNTEEILKVNYTFSP